MTYKELKTNDLSVDLQQQVNTLFLQLTDQKKPIPLSEILVPGTTTSVVCCLRDHKLLGIASMATYLVISGNKGWVEDVVVDHAQRGQGIGRELINCLIAIGNVKGLTEILLFTGYTRKPAIALYERMGFTRKDSHLYIYKFSR